MATKKTSLNEFSLGGSVVVVGSINIDLTSFSLRLPGPGETVVGDDFELVLGGKGANQAIASVLAGGRSHLVGCIGSDSLSAVASDSLRNYGVDTRFVNSVQGSTGIAHIRVEKSGENNIVVVPFANSEVSEAQIDEAFDCLPNARVLMLQLEIPWTTTMYAITKGRAAGLTIILDPAPALSLDSSAWRLIDIVTPNESEAELLTGIRVFDPASAAHAGQWFVKQGVKHALITRGASGVVHVSDKGTEVFHSPLVKVVDTTAAGDAFAGYLAARIADDYSLENAIKQAVLAGALAVTEAGASKSLPNKKQVQNFERRLIRSSSVSKTT